MNNYCALVSAVCEDVHCSKAITPLEDELFTRLGLGAIHQMPMVSLR